METFNEILEQYNYNLPKKLIAIKPAKPRDSAKLLIYKIATDEVFFDTFKNLGKYLPPKSLLIFNRTKVLPARLTVKKQTGGLARLLYLDHNKNIFIALSDRPLKINQVVEIPLVRANYEQAKFKVLKKQAAKYTFKILGGQKNILKILDLFGKTPLPPYIKNSPLSEKKRRSEYQTVFAKNGKSVAAPTAALHFTKSLISKLKRQGHKIVFLNLDVGLGTFAPLSQKNWQEKKLHQEYFQIPKETLKAISQAKKNKQKIIAIGTTSVRTLESLGKFKKNHGQTSLFISPGFKFQIIDGIITNFHVPKSSLMMLIASITGKDALLKLYKKAIKNHFRFFSFGDGMLILP